MIAAMWLACVDPLPSEASADVCAAVETHSDCSQEDCFDVPCHPGGPGDCAFDDFDQSVRGSREGLASEALGLQMVLSERQCSGSDPVDRVVGCHKSTYY